MAVKPAPLVLALVSDLFFGVQIENAVRALGYRLQRVEHGDELEPGLAQRAPLVGEPLAGRGSVFIARVVEWQPALILVELSSPVIPWPDWVASLKSSAATRRVPVVAFGPHTDLALRERAIDAGCDAVIAKGRLVSALPELIEKYARQPDLAGLASGCDGQLSDLAREGVNLFDRGAYFDAHEALEHAWMAETGPVRELYRGLLQVAVAYLQITRGNYRGAVKMFMRMRQWLDPLPARCRGVDVERLRANALAARAELERLGPDRMAEFDPRLLRPVPFALD